jgi:hypothetical protein
MNRMHFHSNDGGHRKELSEKESPKSFSRIRPDYPFFIADISDIRQYPAIKTDGYRKTLGN